MSRLPGMAKPPMPHRTVRVSDELWQAAKAKSDERRENISDVVRRALEKYVADEEPKR